MVFTYLADKVLGFVPWRLIAVGSGTVALGHTIGVFDGVQLVTDFLWWSVGGTLDAFGLTDLWEGVNSSLGFG